MESLFAWLFPLMLVFEDLALRLNQVFYSFSPFHYLFLDLVVLVLVVKTTKYIKYRCRLQNAQRNEGISKDVEGMFEGFKDLMNEKSKGVLGKSDERINFRIIDGLTQKVKQLQDIHSSFQAEVIDSHIKILKVINQCEEKNFLMPPEKELVEPDSALPPLDDDDIEKDLI
jgi:hypothetical protein